MYLSKILKWVVRYIESSERCSEGDKGNTTPITSELDRYLDRLGYQKKVSIKENKSEVNPYRKSQDNKTDLVRDQLKESRTGWYSVFVPNVENNDEVLQIIQTYINPIILYPYNKQYFDYALRFLVDDYKVANALHNTSYKIKQRDDQELIIYVLPYMPPRGPILSSPNPMLSNEVKEKMIEAMATRYNPTTKSLDLSRFYACPLFTDKQLFIALNQPALLLTALNLVAQHTKHDLYSLSLKNNHIYLGEDLVWIRKLFPGLKALDLAGNKFSDLKDLTGLFGYTIEVLNLEGNPLCDTVDKERYKWYLQQLFPTLNKLDNSELPISLGNSYSIPKGHNLKLPNPVISLVETFLTQYYERYDNQVSRQMVLEAYHENATFKLSSSLIFKNVNGSLSEDLPESTNFLESGSHEYVKGRYLYKGKKNIINFFDQLPKSKHDYGSFRVDIPLANAEMIQIVVNGVFAEDFEVTNDIHVFRSFSRTFCIVPVGNGWNIISDMLFITTVTDELLLESSKRFLVFKPKPAKLIHSAEKQPPYQDGLPKSIPQIQRLAPASTVNTKPEIQQQPTFQQPPSTPTSLAINKLSTETPMNLINDANYNKMCMVKNFSKDSGMNSKWAEKCLEENEWDYSKACDCFYYQKNRIPLQAFIYDWIIL